MRHKTKKFNNQSVKNRYRSDRSSELRPEEIRSVPNLGNRKISSNDFTIKTRYL